MHTLLKELLMIYSGTSPTTYLKIIALVASLWTECFEIRGQFLFVQMGANPRG